MVGGLRVPARVGPVVEIGLRVPSVPRRNKHVPRRRNAPAQPALKRSVRKSVVFSGVAVAATGVAVVGGVLAKDEAPADVAASTLAAAQAERQNQTVELEPVQERQVDTSRSDRRSSLEKKHTLDQESGGQATRTEALASQDPREIARQLMAEYGFSDSEFDCLDSLWVSESDWDMNADNPSSSAYGIPQALTGGTHDLPADYMTNPVSQIRWGLEYIEESYGSPCSAWDFKQANDWY